VQYGRSVSSSVVVWISEIGKGWESAKHST
jgi:hypothetical protein